MFGGASLFNTRPFVVGEKVKDIGFMQTKVTGIDSVPLFMSRIMHLPARVITNFSRAKAKVLEGSMQLNNRHIFLVHAITEKVQNYLKTHPSVETLKATPICYLKNMQCDGSVIALSCVIKFTRGAVFYTAQQEILRHVARIITDMLSPVSPFTPLRVPSADANIMNSQEKLIL